MNTKPSIIVRDCAKNSRDLERTMNEMYAQDYFIMQVLSDPNAREYSVIGVIAKNIGR